MQQQTEQRGLTVPSFSVHTEGERFVEIHFHNRVIPPKPTREYLKQNGFRFYQDCNGREEPRYGSRQSTQSWQFVKDFMEEYGEELLPTDAIPEEYREEIDRSPSYTAAAIAPPPTLVVPQPPPEPQPMPRPKAASPGQLDFMSMFEDIFAIANEAVAELDEAAQRRAKLLEELAQWKDWRASWPGGEFRWVLFTSQIAMVATGLAIACIKSATQPVQPIEEDENLKKPEPLPELPESTVEAQPVTTTETHDPTEGSTESQFILTPPSSPEPGRVAKKTKAPRKQKKKEEGGRRQSPTLGAPAFWLDDDELRGTEQYIGCYAVLNGYVGLSFKGLPVPTETVFKRRHLVITKPKTTPFANPPLIGTREIPRTLKTKVEPEDYIARPGTFQPLEMDRTTKDCISGMIAIAEAFARLTSAEGDHTIDADDVEALREDLNFAYDSFVHSHGYIHDKQNKGLTSFCGVTDTRLYMLMALEQEDNDNGCYNKASIFYNRQQYPSLPPTTQLYHDEDPVERIKLAYAKCMDERGLRIDLDLIATLAGMEPDEAEEYLLDGKHPLAFRMPIE